MDYGHPLQAGTLVSPANDAPTAVVDLARLSEELGLDLVTFADHPHEPTRHDAWTLLGWVAARTERIRLAANVLSTPMRPAPVLARAAASLDLLSHGRVELALGAGDAWDALERMGAERLSPHEAVDALGEAVDVIREIWAADPAPLTYRGEHHRLTGAQRGPAPAHNVPIWLGGTEPGLLHLVGAKADGWLASLDDLRPDDLRAGNAAIDDAAAAAGRDPREIRRLLTIGGRFAGTRAGVLDGPSHTWVEDLLPLALDGVSTFLLASDDPETLRRFAGEVVPALREALAAERSVRGTREGTVPSLAIRAARRDGLDYDAVPASLRGDAVEPGDARYAATRSGYMRGGAPGLVLRPGNPAEVAEALAFARSQPVPLSVRSAGHGISGRSTNDGGIILDVSRLNTIEVLDQATRLVRVGPGARWGEVAAALQPYGWAITSGDYGGVGVGGLATAGGIGFLGRRDGLTIDRVRAVELVLADGTLVRASAEEHADLFWAARGAGFALGVATAFEIEAAKVGEVGFAQLVFDADDTAGFLQRWGAVVEASPRDVTSFLIMGAPRGGQVVAQTMTVIDSDDADTILARLQPFAGLGPLAGQAVQIVPYAGVVAPQDPHHGQGEPVARSGLLEHVTPAFAADAARLIRSGETYFFQIRAMGGAMADVAPDATAFAHRSANFSVVAFGAGAERLDRFWDPMRQHFTGLYVSFETDRHPERLREAYPPRTLDRLLDIKRRYDPENVFRDNFDLGPALLPVR
ncbi:LLM class flavin-dependent oxidoreductase [Georgenia yuyongxinii]|uniref:LLM class flavin-dependent oxidoreductase n=1 Tax=Georgenia yuyongxinii TaxID=2589797 RepID=A0A5B8C2P3_9MICO|nr:LLM class flavin-dependent oxidoreductase [Georgenia yuyongxinii]QDC23492.1 LLM class flavin-dependent oxidoreductase [Georgenia yuyongxinii]